MVTASLEQQRTTSRRAIRIRAGVTGWPADFVPGGFQPNEFNIQDMASFVAPTPSINTDPLESGFNVRWDLESGSTFGKQINLADLASLVSGRTGFPPMLGGTKALGQVCPWPP